MKKMDKLKYKDVLKENLTFWDFLNTDEKEKLLAATTYKKFRKGEHINNCSCECTGTIVVVKGSLRVYVMSEEGREVTLYHIKGGDVCVMSASCVLSLITFDVFIDAEKESVCYIVDEKCFDSIVNSNIHAKNFAMEKILSRFSDVVWVLQQVLFMSFDKRLAMFLVEEVEKTDGNEIYLTHEQMAQNLGTVREVVSRMLKYFENEEMIEMSRGKITVKNSEKLKKLI